jgi:hypothetical protein
VDTAKLARRISRYCASAGFLILIVGLTYFTFLVLTVQFGADEARAAAYRELGLFLSGKQAWYQDARVYGALSLVLALFSVLLGPHPLARITIPVSALIYVVAIAFGDQIREVMSEWARR